MCWKSPPPHTHTHLGEHLTLWFRVCLSSWFLNHDLELTKLGLLPERLPHPFPAARPASHQSDTGKKVREVISDQEGTFWINQQSLHLSSAITIAWMRSRREKEPSLTHPPSKWETEKSNLCVPVPEAHGALQPIISVATSASVTPRPIKLSPTQWKANGLALGQCRDKGLTLLRHSWPSYNLKPCWEQVLRQALSLWWRKLGLTYGCSWEKKGLSYLQSKFHGLIKISWWKEILFFTLSDVLCDGRFPVS